VWRRGHRHRATKAAWHDNIPTVEKRIKMPISTRSGRGIEAGFWED